jgi:hypothetical protein
MGSSRTHRRMADIRFLDNSSWCRDGRGPLWYRGPFFRNGRHSSALIADHNCLSFRMGAVSFGEQAGGYISRTPSVDCCNESSTY